MAVETGTTSEVERTLMRKTGKRETAMVLLAWLILMITWIAARDLAMGVEIVKAMIIPVFGLAAAMFGVQVWQQSTAAQLREGREMPPFRGIPEKG